MLKIEDLKVGDALIDCDDIEHVVVKIDFVSERVYIDSDELSYFILFNNIGDFKKKEQPHTIKDVKSGDEYAFNDLIDVAVQANKDRVINGFSVVGEILNCQTLDGEDYNLGIGCEVAHGIKYLQSLYKETFVIESMRDAERMSVGAMITLNNGEIVFYSGIDTNLIYVDSEDRDSIGLPFFVLKGATVEQSRC